MSSYMILVTVVLPVCLLYVHWCGAVAGDTVGECSASPTRILTSVNC